MSCNAFKQHGHIFFGGGVVKSTQILNENHALHITEAYQQKAAEFLKNEKETPSQILILR